MKVLLDLNVLLDVIQQRRPHYDASASVLSAALNGTFSALVPAHALTTIHYVVGRQLGSARADAAIDWMLEHFGVAAESTAVFRRARALPMDDFEDAVVAAVAESERCDFIVTRNTTDFQTSPIQSVDPSRLLEALGSLTS